MCSRSMEAFLVRPEHKAILKVRTKYKEKLRKIYNSSGWRYLISVYRFRDIIINFFKKIKKLGTLFFVVFKHHPSPLKSAS